MPDEREHKVNIYGVTFSDATTGRSSEGAASRSRSLVQAAGSAQPCSQLSDGTESRTSSVTS